MKKQRIFSAILALVVFILSFIGNTSYAFAKEYAEDFDLHESEGFIRATNVKDPGFLEEYPNIRNITISDSIITNEYHFESVTEISEIIFENCEFKISTLNFTPEEDSFTSTIIFTNCKFNADELVLPNTIRTVTFNNTACQKLNPIKYIENLELSDCTLNDLTGFSELKNLTLLKIDSCTLGSLKGIEKLTNLIDLSLHSNVESIKRIEALKNLNYISLNVPYTRDISPLQNLENLVNIYIECSSIESYEPLLNLKSDKIEKIYVFASNLEAFSPKAIELIKKYEDYKLGEDALEIKEKLIEIKNKIIKDGMSDFEIIKTVSEYVVNTIDYDHDVVLLETQEEREALSLEYNLHKLHYALKGKGVCANYSALTTSLLNMCGINCYEIFSFDHVWQLIELNGEYYWLDTTFLEDEWIDCDITECPSFMSQDNEEFIKNRGALLIPSRLYNKLHNIPNDDFKDLEEPEASEVAQVKSENMQTALSKDSIKNNTIVIIIVAVCVIVPVILIILIIEKEKKKISIQNTVDYTDSL